MTLYSKLEKHLPSKKKTRDSNGKVAEYEKNMAHNQCKAQYDEVLRRVVVDEDRLLDIIRTSPRTDDGRFSTTSIAKAIANSPDIFKLKDTQNG